MSLHAFTHCDTSTFKGIGKIRPIKLLLKNKGFQNALSKLGDTWEVPAELNKLEEFTTAMYGRGMYKSVNAVRLDMLRAKCGGTDGIDLSRNVDLGQFPPCLNALQQHIRRANYQTCIWKATDKPRSMAPPTTDGHGWTAVHGKIQPLWFSGPLMPSCTALEDCTLPSDDDNTDDEESDSEADLAFDEYTVSESESDNE